MGLFSRAPKKEIRIVVDIAANSVGGAYVAQTGTLPPIIHHSVRLPIAVGGEGEMRALEAALTGVIRSLIEQGAPAVRRAEGTARPERVLVAVAAPWQKTTARTEHVARPDAREFVFTKRVLEEAVARSSVGSKEHVLTEEIVAGVLLNGYETPMPFGKRARYADLAILSSAIRDDVAHRVHDMLTEAFHTRAVQLLSALPVSYAVLRDVFPHEQDFLVQAISDMSVDMMLVKQGMPYDVVSVSASLKPLLASVRAMADATSVQVLETTRAGAEAEWVSFVINGLRDMRMRHPLPRTVFVIAAPGERDVAKKLLDAPALRALWLSDKPLAIVPVLPSHLASYVSVRGTAEADLPLALLALYARGE